jgi:hypothetical protein
MAGAPLDATIGARLPANEPAGSDYVVALLKASIGTCGPVIVALGTASAAGTPAKEAAKLISEIPTGLIECGCKLASSDDFATGMRLWFGAWAPALRWIELPTLKANDKKPIGKLVK